MFIKISKTLDKYYFEIGDNNTDVPASFLSSTRDHCLIPAIPETFPTFVEAHHYASEIVANNPTAVLAKKLFFYSKSMEESGIDETHSAVNDKILECYGDQLSLIEKRFDEFEKDMKLGEYKPEEKQTIWQTLREEISKITDGIEKIASESDFSNDETEQLNNVYFGLTKITEKIDKISAPEDIGTELPQAPTEPMPAEMPPGMSVGAYNNKPIKVAGRFIVTQKFEFPSWDEKDGIEWEVNATSKSEAIKRAKDKAGPWLMGKSWFSAKEIKSPDEISPSPASANEKTFEIPVVVRDGTGGNANLIERIGRFALYKNPHNQLFLYDTKTEILKKVTDRTHVENIINSIEHFDDNSERPSFKTQANQSTQILKAFGESAVLAINELHPLSYIKSIYKDNETDDYSIIIAERDQNIIGLKFSNNLLLNEIIPLQKESYRKIYASDFLDKYWIPITYSVGHFVIGSSVIVPNYNISHKKIYGFDKNGKTIVTTINIENKDKGLGIKKSWWIKLAQENKKKISDFKQEELINAEVVCTDKKLKTYYSRSGQVLSVIPRDDYIDLVVDFRRGLDKLVLRDDQVDIVKLPN